MDRVAALPQLDIRRSLVDAIHTVLLDAITEGTLAPGDPLREVSIGRHFDVSPTPVREAIRRLERDGLVASHPNRGARVATVSAGQLANLYNIHEVLESHAVRLAASLPGDQPTTADRQLGLLLDSLDITLGLPSQVEFNRADLAFHRALNTLGGNPTLVDLIESIHRRIQSARVQFDIRLPDRPRRSQGQHRQLAAAVAARDPHLAESLAREHIRSIRDPVIAMLAASIGEPSNV